MDPTVSRVLNCLELAEKHGISSFHLREGEFELEFRRGEVQILAPAIPVAPPPAVTVAPVPAPQAAAPVVEPATDAHVIPSPITGTFYAAPAPGAAPFAQVNMQVTVGQTLCIVEAMKMMNEIKSDRNGTLLRILASNEELVRQGQPLFHIETAD